MCGVAHRRGDLYVIVFLLSYNTHITNMFRILYKCHIVSYNFNVIKYSYDIHITTYPYIGSACSSGKTLLRAVSSAFGVLPKSSADSTYVLSASLSQQRQHMLSHTFVAHSGERSNHLSGGGNDRP